MIEGSKTTALIANNDLRPKSASFNNFGPQKRKHQFKAKSLLSPAASTPRFSHNAMSRGAIPGQSRQYRGTANTQDMIDSDVNVSGGLNH